MKNREREREGDEGETGDREEDGKRGGRNKIERGEKGWETEMEGEHDIQS